MMPTKELRSLLEVRWESCLLAGWLNRAMQDSPDDAQVVEWHARAKQLCEEIGARVEKEQEATP